MPVTSRFEPLDAAAYAPPPEVVARTQTPALVVSLDRVRENVRRVLGMLGGDADRWRPHVKTTKIPAVQAELVRAGVRAFKCATTREAARLLDVLDAAGVAGDVLYAHHAFGPALDRLAALAVAHPRSRVSVLSEDPAHAAAVPDAVAIFVDVNPGMHRTGIPLERQADIVATAARAGDRFAGVHFYDGHLHLADAAARRSAAFACYDRLMALAEQLTAHGLAPPELITSGTPTFRYAAAYPRFAATGPGAGPGAGAPKHRVSPGTVVYHDFRSEQDLEDLDLLPAAVVMSRVVSHPAPGIVTGDAGSKALAVDAGHPCAYVLGHPSLEPLVPSEEHLPMRVHDGRPPPRGEIVMLVPRHVCPTVNLAEAALVVDGGEWSVESVAARGHELV